ncbi:hypothetical protein [Flavobacterium urocaniciphilum]|uniref:Uncharacterized protein n=1 Tax=Flavobacterium urocaniciphilum TaxID=1299341 RepID=A0A1H9DU36_9FLAO|nr:hypothetical protein [Flavobacterium urocaniciphilum]SEQ16986.1 hypothetical protein SAMN05444005_10871 [Flavobacterium urocaniciphilum]
MLKNILKLDGVKELTKKEQKNVKGELANVPKIDCWCDGNYAGTCWSVSCCVTTCSMY